MYKIGFEPEAEKEFLALQDKDRALVDKKNNHAAKRAVPQRQTAKRQAQR